MPPEQPGATLAVVVARLDDLREDLKALRTDLAQQRTATVARSEWELRNQHVDHKFAGLGREIGELRTEVRGKRLPWTTVATALVAIISLTIGLIQAVSG